MRIHGLAKTSSCFIAIAAALSSPARAQEGGQAAAGDAGQDDSSIAAQLMGDIVVTGSKKSRAEAAQVVPITISAFGEAQLDLLQVNGVADLGRRIPNVQLEDVGTQKGTANFSIRGMGINVSVPSLDPTVGVFTDGVYIGTSFGVVTDSFDLGGVEVLRGPQGVLFGRNVTGGAILINSKNPSREFEGYMKAAYESGDALILQGAVSGPIVKDKLLVRLALYDNNDNGYYRNLFDGSKVGDTHTRIARVGVTLLPSDATELTIKYENGSIEGDGTVGRNFAILPNIKENTNVNLDYPGYTDDEWDFVSANFQAELGSGTLTNIAGWKRTLVETGFDADQTPLNSFHTRYNYLIKQWSEELRYNVPIGDLAEVTAGLYYFTQKMTAIEDRAVFANAPALFTLRTGGGKQSQDTYGAYLSVDWKLAPTVTLTTGGRYSYEKKHAQVTRVLTANTAICNVDRRTCSSWQFEDKDNWGSFSPKVGIQWFATPDTQIFGSYTRGFRSGGYNLRITEAAGNPGPFDQETQDAFELGWKTDLFDKRLRLNGAIFYNKFKNLQRAVLQASIIGGGTTTDIVNSADATIKGLELEAQLRLTENLVIGGNLGLLDGNYDKVFFDINADRVINQLDKDLAIPRLAKTSYGLDLTYGVNIAGGFKATTLVAFNHRSKSASSDNNAGIIPKANLLDATVTLADPSGQFELSLYGKNLTKEVVYGSVNPLPQSPFFGFSGTTKPTVTQVGKGRVFGAELTYRFP